MQNYKKIFNRIIQKIKKSDRVLWLVFGLITIFIFYFTFIAFVKHDNFLTGRYDLGNMDQTVWNTINGRIFMFTNPDLNSFVSRLSAHADFILILISPFYFIWENPKMLLLIQTITSGLGALFVYLIGKDVLKQRLLPLVLTISFLFHPFFQRQNTFDFHPVVLATTFLLAAFYFLNKNKYFGFFIFLVLAILTKEHVYLASSLLGVYIFFVKRKKWGIVLAGFSALAFYLLVSKIIPDARGSSHFALEFFNNFGDSPIEVIKTLIVNPGLTISTLIKNNILEYYKNLFLPVGFLSFLSPLYLIFALPELLMNSLSGKPEWRMYYYQYAAISIPFIYISAIFGIKRFLSKYPKSAFKIVMFLFITILYSSFTAGPLFFAKDPDKSVLWVPENKELIMSFLKTIPASVSVASTNNLGAYLSHRIENYSLENGFQKAQYVLFLVKPNSIEKLENKDWDLIKLRSLLNNKNYKVIYRLNNFVVFQKIAD
jgi:uncharacterized membrane protein